MMQTLDYLKKLEENFMPGIKYGIKKNDNKKYLDMGYRWIIAAVFPYYNGGDTALFSKYCSIPDYHTVLKEEFDKILKPIFKDYKIMADISPFKEKILAQSLGLGEIGENNLLLTKDYGSYVFIAEALIKEELCELSHEKENICLHCGNCKKACPNNALKDGFIREKCLSYLTQKKNISDSEEELLKNASVIFGCDICQTSCPVNKNAKKTFIEKFKENSLSLTKEEILLINEEEFSEKYKDYAFCYKGAEILKRNVRIINGN